MRQNNNKTMAIGFGFGFGFGALMVAAIAMTLVAAAMKDARLMVYAAIAGGTAVVSALVQMFMRRASFLRHCKHTDVAFRRALKGKPAGTPTQQAAELVHH